MDNLESLTEHLFHSVNGIKRSIDAVLQRRFGIRYAQYKILNVMLHNGGGLEQIAIAKSSDQSEAAVSRQVMILAKKGLITVKKDPANKRIHSIIFTEAGVRCAQASALTLEELLTVKFRTFSDAERAALQRLIQKI